MSEFYRWINIRYAVQYAQNIFTNVSVIFIVFFLCAALLLPNNVNNCIAYDLWTFESVLFRSPALAVACCDLSLFTPRLGSCVRFVLQAQWPFWRPWAKWHKLQSNVYQRAIVLIHFKQMAYEIYVHLLVWMHVVFETRFCTHNCLQIKELSNTNSFFMFSFIRWKKCLSMQFFLSSVHCCRIGELVGSFVRHCSLCTETKSKKK